MKTFEEIKEELKPWVKHNFGDRESWQPLLGIIEELSELEFAKTVHELKDAIGDTMIYVLDFCNSENISLEEVFTSSYSVEYYNINYSIGKLCHSYLKMKQGIRLNEAHKENVLKALSSICNYLYNYYDVSIVLNITNDTWNKVKQRDWKKNPSQITT